MTDLLTRIRAANPTTEDDLAEHDFAPSLAAVWLAVDGSSLSAAAATPPRRRRRRRITLAAASVAVLVAAPAATFASGLVGPGLGGLFTVSDHGTPVTPSALSHDSSLARVMANLGSPSSLRLLGILDGISFYAASTRHGYCFAAVQARTPAAICTPVGVFPSGGEPVEIVPVAGRLAGFAADDIVTVAVLNSSGTTLATAPVSGNLFVGGTMPAQDQVLTIEALAANGDVLATYQRGPVAQRPSTTAPSGAPQSAIVNSNSAAEH